jgi:hypothetical protein
MSMVTEAPSLTWSNTIATATGNVIVGGTFEELAVTLRLMPPPVTVKMALSSFCTCVDGSMWIARHVPFSDLHGSTALLQPPNPSAATAANQTNVFMARHARC